MIANFKPALSKLAPATAVAAGIALSAGAAQAQTFLKMSSLQAGSPGYTISTAIINIVQKNTDLKIQLSAGETQTRAMLQGARGKLDIMMSTPFAVFWMKKKVAMYKKVKDAPEMAARLRNILSFPLGTIYVVTKADSGIETFKDLKGKRVFMGPPGGGAYNIAKAMIVSSGGLKDGEDFTSARLDWRSGSQAFQDGNVAAYLGAGTVPNPLVEQFALGGNLRFLSMPESAFEHPAAKGLISLPGFVRASIDAAGYKGKVVNKEPVNSIAMWAAITSHTGVAADHVHKITKAVLDNLKDLHATAPWLKSITRDTVLAQMNLPLHAGAYRAYKEAGLKIPAALVPPEAAK